MIRRLKLFWKLALLAALIPLSVGVGMMVSLRGVRQLEAEYDHLYGFMRIPLLALDEANTRREALEGDLRELTRSDLSPEQRTLLVQRIRESDRAMATLARYRQEWLTTLNADFTARLESNTRAQAVLERMVSQWLLLGLLLSLAGLLAAWGLSRLIGRPLEGLIRLTSGVSPEEREKLEGEAWARPDPHARDEVGTLLRTTWEMVDSTERMAVAALAFARGDLTVRIEPRSEKDVLGNALMLLTEILSGLRESAPLMVEACSGTSSVARSVFEGANQQAAHLDDLLPGIIRVLVDSVTEHAMHCRRLEQTVICIEQEASFLDREFSQAGEAMEDLASKVSLIEELVSQTNLLALNATLGAARAGEHGRDLAVVAQEVHKLGERSQTAVRDFGARVASSERQVMSSWQALEGLRVGIQATREEVRQVAEHSHAHTQYMHQLHLELSDLFDTAMRTSEASKQLAAAAEQLVLGARAHQQSTALFHLEPDPETPKAATP